MEPEGSLLSLQEPATEINFIQYNLYTWFLFI
jgi:hypothetical protein